MCGEAAQFFGIARAAADPPLGVSAFDVGSISRHRSNFHFAN